MSDAQPNTLRPATTRRIARMRARRSLARHVDRLDQRVGEAVDVVRIDDERLVQLLRRARQRAQHQHAVLVVARRDELLGDEVHPVVQRADDAEVREAVERDEARQRRAAPCGSRRRGGTPGMRVPRVELR